MDVEIACAETGFGVGEVELPHPQEGVVESQPEDLVGIGEETLTPQTQVSA